MTVGGGIGGVRAWPGRIGAAWGRWAARRQEHAEGVWHGLVSRSGPRRKRVLLLLERTVLEYRDDGCPQLAAAVAYHVLLSIFPLVILLISVFGLVANEGAVRDTIVRTVTTYVPLTPSGKASLEHLLSQLQGGSATLGLLSLIGVFISASGMMAALRRALTLAWDAEQRRSLVRGKLMDLVLVVVAGVLLGASLGLTIAFRFASGTSGWLGFFTRSGGAVVGALLPMLLAFVLFSFLFSTVPAVTVYWRDIWPGALLAAVLFQILKEGFALYLTHFGHYNAVYGSLGAAAVFVFFVYLSANAMLLGAEMAAEYPRLPDLPAESG